MPARMKNGTAEKPNGVSSVANVVRAPRGRPAPLAALEDPEDREPEPGAEDRRRRRRAAVGARPAANAEPAAQEQDDGDDHRLAREHVAPAELGRHPAADQRPGSDRGARDPADDPERQRPPFPVIGTAISATIDGSTIAAPIPSTRDQPNSRTVRFGLSAVVSEPTP